MTNKVNINIDNIISEVRDATVFNGEMEGRADVVMADLPCSGLGVLGRKCDIRHNIDTDAIKELSDHVTTPLLEDGIWNAMKQYDLI